MRGPWRSVLGVGGALLVVIVASVNMLGSRDTGVRDAAIIALVGAVVLGIAVCYGLIKRKPVA